MAPLPPLLIGSAVLLLGDRPDYPYLILAITAVCTVLARYALVRGNRDALLAVPAPQRRHLRAVFGGNTVVLFVFLFIVWWTTPADQPDRLLLVYPLWLAAVGTAFFSLAAHAGVMYVLGGVSFALAVIAAMLLPWSPLVVALF